MNFSLFAPDGVKVLCTGDIHIGRRPSRLPDHLDTRALSCGACWNAIVDLALAEGVDVVAISGDVVDRANRFYEAVGPLELGIRRLAQAGVVTVAVAGNHDFDVLPWLAEGLGPDHFRLLGRGGAWERTTIQRNGVPVLHLDGWSFPEAHARISPLAAYDLPRDDGLPVLGLLHADLDQPASPYAPVTLAELRRRPVGFWLLGHVHAPALHLEEGAAPVLYPGSPQAMDPGETGAHGVWVVEVDGGGRFRARQVSLSRVRYETVEIDVDGVEEELELDHRIATGLRDRLREVVEAGCGPLQYLSCRLRLTGRTPLHRRLEDLEQRIGEEPPAVLDEVTALVERVEIATRPARDLDQLARGDDAAAVLAGLLRALESGQLDGEQDDLLRHAAQQLSDVYRARPFRHLSEAPPSAEEERPTQYLHRQALLLLDELLAQKEAI